MNFDNVLIFSHQVFWANSLDLLDHLHRYRSCDFTIFVQHLIKGCCCQRFSSYLNWKQRFCIDHSKIVVFIVSRPSIVCITGQLSSHYLTPHLQSLLPSDHGFFIALIKRQKTGQSWGMVLVSTTTAGCSMTSAADWAAIRYFVIWQDNDVARAFALQQHDRSSVDGFWIWPPSVNPHLALKIS